MSAAETGLLAQLVGRKALQFESVITAETAFQEPVADMLYVVSSGTDPSVGRQLYIVYSTSPSTIGVSTSAAAPASLEPMLRRHIAGGELDYLFGSFHRHSSAFIRAKDPVSYDVSHSVTASPGRRFALVDPSSQRFHGRATEEEEHLAAPKTKLAQLLLRHRERVRREGGKFRGVEDILAELEASRTRAIVV